MALYLALSKIGMFMSNILIFGLGLFALVAVIASLWYLYKTVRVMWAYNSLLAIAAIIFSPLVHIAFYFMPKDGFDNYEKGIFKSYFTSIGVLIALGVVAAVTVPTAEPQNTIVDEANASQPWEWDIRAENQEEVLTQTEANSSDSDIAKAESLHYEAIFQVHPDADKVVDSPEFALWLQGQTAEEYEVTAKVLKEGIASEVIYVLSNFKTDLATYRANEYQVRQDNAKALAQRKYQEKQSRELESIKSSNQRSYDQQRQQQQLSANATPQPNRQALSSQNSLSYSERQEREKLKALLSKPHKGSNGELTRSQREALVALETGQPMPSNSQNNGGSIPTPSNITSCDGSGCWDTNGTRYNKGAGNTYFPSTGGSCQNVGGQMQCN